MRPFILEPRTAESTFAHAIALDGTVDAETETSSIGLVYWRWQDDPAMLPQYLGEQKIGESLRVPFENPDRRAIRLYAVGKTKQGNVSVQDLYEARQTVFYPPDSPVIESAVFDPTPDEVTLTFTGNGGEGSISILRKIDTGDFAVIATVAYNETEYVDSPEIDGDYSYKLTQANVNGESNTVSVAVTGVSSPAGSAPSGLDAVFDPPATVNLSWTNNGGTGLNVVERKSNAFGGTAFQTVASEIAAATTSSDTVPTQVPYAVIYTYRVWNTSVAGYSNTVDVYVPAGEGEF